MRNYAIFIGVLVLIGMVYGFSSLTKAQAGGYITGTVVLKDGTPGSIVPYSLPVTTCNIKVVACERKKGIKYVSLGLIVGAVDVRGEYRGDYDYNNPTRIQLSKFPLISLNIFKSFSFSRTLDSQNIPIYRTGRTGKKYTAQNIP